MVKIVGYGEDSLTLWALKHRLSAILEEEGTAPSDCLVFYRPSFGRHSKNSKAVFGEFDAIIVSPKNIYLIESKWDNLGKFNKDELILREEQELRHNIFSWYLMHWDKKYSNDWKTFVKEQQSDFQSKFEEKTIAPVGSKLLAKNLEFILTKIREYCKKFSSENNIKNVLLFFYDAEKSKPPIKINRTFRIVPIKYDKEMKDNFVTLSEEE